MTKLNLVFFIEILFVFLIATDIMPREGALFLAIFLSAVFAFIFSLEESVFLTARSIPLFLALPITESFDNFNIWRILVLVLFIRWCFLSFSSHFSNVLRAYKLSFCHSRESGNLDSIDTGLDPRLRGDDKKNSRDNKKSSPKFRLEILVGLLAFVAVLSLLKADDPIAGIKRIIYFANMGMLFFVVRSVTNRNNFMALGKNFIISGIIVATVGALQLISAYLMPINNFAEYWAFIIERNLYGNAWAQITISANTWFAYFNNTIHLRMFSSFPDSHSFPLYLLIISVFIATFISFKKITGQTCPPDRMPVRTEWMRSGGVIRAGKPAHVLLGIFSLCIVLSGTRGIWAAATLPILIIGFYYFKKYQSKEIISKLFLPIIFFIIALVISQPIFNSKQFKLIENETEESRVLISRLVSIFDTEETSNQGRIWIWKESVKSIVKNPLLGVGIGNFPTVLKQDVALAKAGSSAHNLFLQILAEMGIIAFAMFLLIIYEIFKKTAILSKQPDILIKFFGLFSILYLAWILLYTMTDPAIFDERVFLGLMILIGAIYALADNESPVIL